VAWAAQISFKG